MYSIKNSGAASAPSLGQSSAVITSNVRVAAHLESTSGLIPRHVPASSPGSSRRCSPPLSSKNQEIVSIPAPVSPPKPATQTLRLSEFEAEYRLVPLNIPFSFTAPPQDVLLSPSVIAGRALTEDERAQVAAWAQRLSPKMTLMQGPQEWFQYMETLEKAMAGDEELSQKCLAVMHNGMSDCRDRALLMFQEIETACLTRRAEKGDFTGEELFEVGKGMYRLSQVDVYVQSAVSQSAEEVVEYILHARQILRKDLNLPVPKIKAESSDLAYLIDEFSKENLEWAGDEILSIECHNEGENLAEFLASWEPMTNFLLKAHQEVAAARQAILAHRDTVLAAIEDHQDGQLQWGSRKLPPLNFKEYARRLEQCGSSAQRHIEAVNLAAVRGLMGGESRTALEAALAKVYAVRTKKDASTYLPNLEHALQRGTARADWFHPTQRWTFAHVAAAGGRDDLIEALLAKGGRANQADSSGITPLHLAALSGSVQAVASLIHAGADVKARDKYDNTPLHWGAKNACSRTVIEALSTQGAEVNAKREADAETPLFIAAKNGHAEAVRTLLSVGANPLITAMNGSMPLKEFKKATRKNRDAQQYRQDELTIKALKKAEQLYNPAEASSFGSKLAVLSSIRAFFGADRPASH